MTDTPNEPRRPKGARVIDLEDEKTQTKHEESGPEFSSVGKTRSDFTKQYRDLAESIESAYQMVGMIAGMAARNDFQKAAAVNIINQSGAVADSWVELAEKNPKVKAALQKFVAGTASAQIISIHATMVLPMLSAYGVIPPNLGVMILGKEAAEAAASAPNG